MNNSDMPANPVRGADNVPFNMSRGMPPFAATGLTKREHFAAMAMQGLLVNMGRNGYSDAKSVSGEALKQADALLKALEGEG